jgi:hypothetical protein
MSEEKKKIRRRVVVPRELLLVEVERYCRDPACGARNAIGLTKEEARVYDEFTCERCEQSWDDCLSERDIPEWWEELRITSLEGLRPARSEAAEETEGTVARLSEAWRAGRSRDDAATSSGNGEDSF